MKKTISTYVAPALTVLGRVEELTLTTGFCDKTLGGSDGFTFQQNPIHCNSA
jgi:hypothetical protein